MNEVFLLNKRGLIEQASKATRIRILSHHLCSLLQTERRRRSVSCGTLPLLHYLTTFWKHFALCLGKEA